MKKNEKANANITTTKMWIKEENINQEKNEKEKIRKKMKRKQQLGRVSEKRNINRKST